MNKIAVNLGEVQETMLIPLWSRAAQTKCKDRDPLIYDPKSIEIVEKLDYDFGKFENSQGSVLTCALRAVLLDNWVKEYISKYPQGTIVDIGVGLNTRFERVDNGQIHYFDMDLPDAMALRMQLFEETDRRKFIADSVLDDAWVEQVLRHSQGAPCMFVVEGVFQYMDEEKVKKAFGYIRDNFPGSWLIFDSMSPSLVKKSQTKHDALDKIKAKFSWGILNVKDLEKWDQNYKVQEIKTYYDLPDKYLKEFSNIQKIIFKIFPYPYRMTLVKIK